MKVLVVEDDPEIAVHIGRGLSALGHETDVAPSGAAAIRACGENAFDAIVLDRMLPDMPGIAVLDRLQADLDTVPPIVILSALGSVEDRVEGLLAGADDYLTKPFELAELNARVCAIARRRKHEAREPESVANQLLVGRLSLDPAGHRARYAGDDIALNRKEYSILAFLMRHRDRVVTRAMLLEGVWSYAFEPTTNIVESNLSRLRARLQCLGIDPIETRRGAGYVLRSERCY
ncbi:MAG: response regulator transcription factor [Sphingomonadales bacterium]|nr:response regulator transcription factor [Sphingomonadales bacterium]